MASKDSDIEGVAHQKIQSIAESASEEKLPEKQVRSESNEITSPPRDDELIWWEESEDQDPSNPKKLVNMAKVVHNLDYVIHYVSSMSFPQHGGGWIVKLRSNVITQPPNFVHVGSRRSVNYARVQRRVDRISNLCSFNLCTRVCSRAGVPCSTK